MTFLFDTTTQFPQEPSRGRKPARRRREGAVEPPRPEFSPVVVAVVSLGRVDDGVMCLDQNCQAECHDIVEEIKGQWLVECCFCGTGQWIKAIPNLLPKPSPKDSFRLRDGRFAGLTLEEAAMLPRGLDYIRWAAGEHPRHAVREAAKTWLASRPANP